MTLLPIVERELRIASRRWLTFWGRVGAAGFTLLIFIGMEVIAETSRSGYQAGRFEFGLLKWMCFAFACLAGLFLTADCLSEEKREGTLGLLFLTDLRGYDVVFGKLISRSLQAFYGFLAAIPILGLCLLVGGVAGREFRDSLLVMCNTLFLSLCVGLFVSSVSRDVMKSMNGTLFIFLYILIGSLITDWFISGWNPSRFRPLISMGSPAYLFFKIGAYPFRDFWLCLGIQHGVAWLFLVLACLYTPRAWHEKATQSDSPRGSVTRRLRYGGKNFRLRFRRKMLDRDAILWLAVRDRWLPRFVWCVIVIGLGILAFTLVYNWRLWPLQVASYIAVAFQLALLLWVASQSCRFFVDAIRNGAMELILVTPVVPAQIVRSQWRGLCRCFLLPALVLIGVRMGGFIVEIIEMTHRSVKFSAGFNALGYEVVGSAVSIVKFAGNLVAVAWFGMWMGMTTRKSLFFAIFKTICFALILPGIALLFCQGFIMAAFGMLQMPFWTSNIVVGGLSLAKNVFFVIWARQRLNTGFREAILRESRIAPYVPTQIPPQWPPTPPAPPPLMPPPIYPSGVT